jgi:hypothetical protein
MMWRQHRIKAGLWCRYMARQPGMIARNPDYALLLEVLGWFLMHF